MSRLCHYCNKDISNEHRNRKYCSNECVNKARYKRDGQRSTSEQRKEWYEIRKQKDGYVEKLREQDRKRYEKVQKFIRRHKLMRGCADCGYNEHHVALDFDHLEEKKINVSSSKSIQQAKEEIRKCEVVCSNCHRIRTYKRIHNN